MLASCPRVSHLHSRNLNPESIIIGSASSEPRASCTRPSAYATAKVGAVLSAYPSMPSYQSMATINALPARFFLDSLLSLSDGMDF